MTIYFSCQNVNSNVVKWDFLTDSQTLCSRTIEGLGCKSEYSVKLDTFRDAVFNGYTKVRNLCRMKREKSSSFSSVFAAAECCSIMLPKIPAWFFSLLFPWNHLSMKNFIKLFKRKSHTAFEDNYKKSHFMTLRAKWATFFHVEKAEQNPFLV